MPAYYWRTLEIRCGGGTANRGNRGKTPDNWGHATNLMRPQVDVGMKACLKKSRDHDLAPGGSSLD